MIRKVWCSIPSTDGSSRTLAFDVNVYKYTPCVFKRIYSISCVVSLLAKRIFGITYDVTRVLLSSGT